MPRRASHVGRRAHAAGSDVAALPVRLGSIALDPTLLAHVSLTTLTQSRIIPFLQNKVEKGEIRGAFWPSQTSFPAFLAQKGASEAQKRQ